MTDVYICQPAPSQDHITPENSPATSQPCSTPTPQRQAFLWFPLGMNFTLQGAALGCRLWTGPAVREVVTSQKMQQLPSHPFLYLSTVPWNADVPCELVSPFLQKCVFKILQKLQAFSPFICLTLNASCTLLYCFLENPKVKSCHNKSRF